MPLDHFGSSKGQKHFRNRYWVNKSAYKPGGPVFIYDTGQQDASGVAPDMLSNDQSVFKQLYRQYNGIGVILEHRYYGASTPMPINSSTPIEDFQFLTIAQSL